MLPTKFKSTDLFVQEKKWKYIFKMAAREFLIVMILAIFALQVTPMLPTKFRVNWPFGSGKEAKIDFQDGHRGGHLGFSTGTILAVFVLQISTMLPAKFQANWPFGSVEEAKNEFSRWPPRWPSWNSNPNGFSYFWSTGHLDASYQVSSQLAFGFRIRSEK